MRSCYRFCCRCYRCCCHSGRLRLPLRLPLARRPPTSSSLVPPPPFPTRQPSRALSPQADIGVVRFYGRTDADTTRVIHFKTSSAELVSYLNGTGSGTVSALIAGAAPLAGHEATLPGGLSALGSQANNEMALTYGLFTGIDSTHNWQIRGPNAADPAAPFWSMDDAANTTRSTLHQVWVRPSGVDEVALAENTTMTSYGNCKALKDADADAPSGVYYFTINNQVVRVYCDMANTTGDGGGWMLVLNYVRGGGHNPPLQLRNPTNGFPLLRSTRLGSDESWVHGARSPWGHVDATSLSKARTRTATALRPFALACVLRPPTPTLPNDEKRSPMLTNQPPPPSLLAAASSPPQVDFDEVRFFGRTKGSTKVLHFKTWASSLVGFLKNYSPTSIVVANQMRVFNTRFGDHNASLPVAMSSDTTGGSSADGPLTLSLVTAASAGWSAGASAWRVEGGYSEASATLQQVWVRPSMLETTIASAPTFLLKGTASAPMHRAANMSDPNLNATTVFQHPASVQDSSLPVALPFAFKLFGVNYGNDSTTGGLHLGDNGYITLGAGSAVTTISSPSDPGAGLFLGAANRSLLFYGLTTDQTENGLKYATAVIRYYSSASGLNEDQVNLEVTFATDGENQFIEIRAGSISYGATGAGTWGLSDGFKYAVDSTAMPALASGESMVLQSDAEGRYWKPHTGSSLSIRAPPAPVLANGAAATGAAGALCLLLRGAAAKAVPRSVCRPLARPNTSAALPHARISPPLSSRS